jgi:uncharacterized membrane protein
LEVRVGIAVGCSRGDGRLAAVRQCWAKDAALVIQRRSPLAPGLLLGIGLGGFVDGIVLHQILQWHHMLTATDRYPSSTIAGLQANTVADGLFHAATWVLVFIGMCLAIKAWQQGRLAPPWRVHVGLLVVGWGAFNVVEGLVDHHLLGVHHVRDDVSSPLPWDLGFLAFGVALVAVGLGLVRSGRRATAGGEMSGSSDQRRQMRGKCFV